MEFLGRTLEWLSVALPLLGCALGWWLWVRERKTVSIQAWRRIAGLAALLSATTGIALGAFAWAYWIRFPEPRSGPPNPTYVATYVGFYLTLAMFPPSLCAKAGTRAALLLCFVGLLGFYFLMFLSP
jgi:hypothetical protein